MLKYRTGQSQLLLRHEKLNVLFSGSSRSLSRLMFLSLCGFFPSLPSSNLFVFASLRFSISLSSTSCKSFLLLPPYTYYFVHIASYGTALKTSYVHTYTYSTPHLCLFAFAPRRSMKMHEHQPPTFLPQCRPILFSETALQLYLFSK